jgi:hypothetical protein
MTSTLDHTQHAPTVDVELLEAAFAAPAHQTGHGIFATPTVETERAPLELSAYVALVLFAVFAVGMLALIVDAIIG